MSNEDEFGYSTLDSCCKDFRNFFSFEYEIDQAKKFKFYCLHYA